jgi:methylated-DNA-[protein]-cysteine S-methyltransferase
MQPEAPMPPLPRQLWSGSLASPAGEILLVWDEEARVRALDFDGHQGRRDQLLARHYGPGTVARPAPVPQAIATPIDAYFAGDLPAIHTLAHASAGTGFQRRVWRALLEVPVGSTWSYADIATAIGNPRGVRAVGLANGANPIALIVPCHRVIGSNGSLTGYGGGLERKLWLLRHEGALIA